MVSCLVILLNIYNLIWFTVVIVYLCRRRCFFSITNSFQTISTAKIICNYEMNLKFHSIFKKNQKNVGDPKVK